VPRPIFRAKGPDEPASSAETRVVGNAATIPLSMPTPEQLGIVRASAADRGDLDWTAAHRQLERLGAIGFRVEKLETGGCRFACLLPTRQPRLTHRVEAEAATEAEAVNLALAQAEKWTNVEAGGSK
jgi:hypothetical protein